MKPRPEKILVVDDDEGFRELLVEVLDEGGYRADQAVNVAEARTRTQQRQYDLVLTDLRLPNGSGMDVLDYAKRKNPESQVIMMTAYATTENAIEAMKRGAYDYIIKPFKVDEVSVIVHRAL